MRIKCEYTCTSAFYVFKRAKLHKTRKLNLKKNTRLRAVCVEMREESSRRTSRNKDIPWTYFFVVSLFLFAFLHLPYHSLFLFDVRIIRQRYHSYACRSRNTKQIRSLRALRRMRNNANCQRQKVSFKGIAEHKYLDCSRLLSFPPSVSFSLPPPLSFSLNISLSLTTLSFALGYRRDRRDRRRF